MLYLINMNLIIYIEKFCIKCFLLENIYKYVEKLSIWYKNLYLVEKQKFIKIKL